MSRQNCVSHPANAACFRRKVQVPRKMTSNSNEELQSNNEEHVDEENRFFHKDDPLEVVSVSTVLVNFKKVVTAGIIGNRAIKVLETSCSDILMTD